MTDKEVDEGKFYMDKSPLTKSVLRWNAPVTLDLDDGTSRLALVQDIERHPLSRKYMHVDFRLVDEDSTVTRKIPVRLEGSSPGAAMGGKLQHLRRFVRLRTVVSSIPEAIVVDISALDIGDKILMSSQDLPGGCVLDEGDFAVVICEGRTKKEEKQEEELVFL